MDRPPPERIVRNSAGDTPSPIEASANATPPRNEAPRSTSDSQPGADRDATDAAGTEAAFSGFGRSPTPVVRSEDLLRGQREAIIVHGSETYRLICTRNNKLILQK